MKHIVHKAFWDYEKEEKWLNAMSAKGMALTDYSWCRYVFEESQNNEYTYRIELLENLPKNAESVAYIRFLEENDIEYVASYMRWIYLRKKTAEGDFDIYSDIDHKIKHFKRINAYWMTLMLLELILGSINVIVGLISLFNDNSLGNAPISNLIIGGILIMVGLLYLKFGTPIRRKIAKLQQEKAIRE